MQDLPEGSANPSVRPLREQFADTSRGITGYELSLGYFLCTHSQYKSPRDVSSCEVEQFVKNTKQNTNNSTQV